MTTALHPTVEPVAPQAAPAPSPEGPLQSMTMVYTPAPPAPPAPPVQALLPPAPEAGVPAFARAPAGTPIILGTPGNDTIDAGHGGNILVGSTGADTFSFANLPISAATPLTHIADYSFAQGDRLDLSALTFQFHGSGGDDQLLARVAEDPSGTFATVQVNDDSMGTKFGPNWIGIAQLDGVHAGDRIATLIDSHSAVHLIQLYAELMP